MISLILIMAIIGVGILLIKNGTEGAWGLLGVSDMIDEFKKGRWFYAVFFSGAFTAAFIVVSIRVATAMLNVDPILAKSEFIFNLVLFGFFALTFGLSSGETEVEKGARIGILMITVGAFFIHLFTK